MTGRGVMWGCGVAVVLAAVTGGLTNELHGGWPWWVADAGVTLTAAVLAMWLSRASSGPGSTDVADGGVYAGRDLRGKVRTQVHGGRPARMPGEGSALRVGRGAVAAGRDVTESVDTDITDDRN